MITFLVLFLFFFLDVCVVRMAHQWVHRKSTSAYSLQQELILFNYFPNSFQLLVAFKKGMNPGDQHSPIYQDIGWFDGV